MKKLLIAMIAIALGELQASKAQVSASFNTTAVGVSASTDRFSHDGKQIANYGLGWYNDSWFTGGPTAYMASWGGLKFFAQGALAMSVNKDGNVGVGVSNPMTKLHISDSQFITIGNYSNSNTSKGIYFTGFRDTRPNYFGASIEATPTWRCCNGFPGAGYAGVKYINLDFYVHDDYEQASSKKLAMSVRSSGDVTIGTTDSRGYKLAVNGNIRAKEVKVETANWPDYVFGGDYQLPDLKELSAYIRENRHLPGMPSAKEAEADGIDLGEMNRKLLEKVEELTLHLLEQSAKIGELEKRDREKAEQIEYLKSKL